MSNPLTQFSERLRNAGLVVECVEADGLLHRCGTSDKPHSKNGAYKAHLDAPVSIWWTNWRTGDSGTWCAKAETSLSAAEREVLKKRIAEAKEAAAKEREERHAKAAETAEWIWSKCPAATNEHPYLQRKEVPSFGLRLAQDGRLMVPVLGEDGKLQSLQFIAGDGSKLFLSGGRTAVGYFPIPAKDGGKTGPLLIAEGYATGASLHLATGAAVLIGFNAANLGSVAKMARKLYPEREILLCADNDCENAKPDGTPFNPGVESATKAAATIGAKLAVCLALDGKKADFNDLHVKRGLGAVKEAVEAVLRNDTTPNKTALRVVNIAELLSLNVPPRGHLLYPVLQEQGLCMVFADRGTGKTFAALSIAYAVASGGCAFGWKAPQACPVLYIDGEMPFSAMQERLASIVQGSESEPPDASYLRLLTPDLQGDNVMPNLSTTEGQEAVEPLLHDVRLVVIDNLATLARAGRSNEEESWTPMQTWILSLRRRGISVLLIHHASKNGSQRGTSAKEDILDTVIQLRRPNDYAPEQGARFEVHLTKARGLFGQEAEPFEATLKGGTWDVRPLEDALADQIRNLAAEGLTIREIAEEAGKSKSTVSRLCRKLNITTKGGRA